MLTDQQILEKFVKEVSKKLKERIPTATGKTADGITTRVLPDRAQVLAPFYIAVLERGRKPRKSSENAGFADALKAWMESSPNFLGAVTESSVKQLAWHINKHGTELWAKQKKSGVLSEFDITKELNILKNDLGLNRAIHAKQMFVKHSKITR